MVAQPIATMSEEEYLAFERPHEERHEFRDGQVYEMPHITMPHRRIVFDTAMQLHGQVRATNCEVLFTNMRVKVLATGMYAYPDIIIFCGESRLEDGHEDTLLNPTVLIEVLSPASEGYDRGTKWRHYQEIAALQEYLLIAHHVPMIEHYVRLDDGGWCYRTTRGLEASVELPSVGCTLRLAEVYREVAFE